MKLVRLTIHGFDAVRWIAARKQNAEWEQAFAEFGPTASGTYVVHIFKDRRGVLADIIIRGIDHRMVEGPIDRDYLKEPIVAYPPGQPSIVAYPFRWEHRCSVLERYEPLSEAERARRAESRKAKAEKRAIERWNEAHPLFAEQHT